MGDIKDGEFGDTLWVEKSDAPRYSGAPIMAGEEDALMAELVGDGEDVGREFRERVGGSDTRFAASVVSTLIGDDHTEANVSERLDLSVPGIPEFGKAVEQDDHGSVGRAGGDGM
jgi:hypothetical protein